jgi:methyl-accepting chemotaxis protein
VPPDRSGHRRARRWALDGGNAEAGVLGETEKAELIMLGWFDRLKVARQIVLAVAILAVIQAVVSTVVFTRLDPSDGTRLWLVAAPVVAQTFVAYLALRVSRRVTASMRGMARVLRATSQGDLTARVPLPEQADEMSGLLRRLNSALDGIHQLMTDVNSTAASLTSTAGHLSHASERVSGGATQVNTRSSNAAGRAQQVAEYVGTVATTSQHMRGMITEIAASASEGSDVAGRAVTVAEATNAMVARLGESSHEIDDVVKVITSIAEQTNLLALNATIEAARAGDAGKGFAVVASEVKELSQETAKATEDISRRMAAVQSDAAGVIAAITEISGIIQQLNNHQGVIADALETHTSHSREVGHNVDAAVADVTVIAADLAEMTAITGESAEVSHDGQRLATELVDLSQGLTRAVAQFRI